MKVKIVFFYSFINELIYIKISKKMKTNINKNIMCKLLKALYSLKQSCFQFKRLSTFFLKQLGFKQIYIDHSIFITNADFNRPIVSMFVNDIKIMSIKKNLFIKNVKKKLIIAFLMIKISLISFYLSFKVDQN